MLHLFFNLVWRDLTKIISILNWRLRFGIESRPPRWEASTLEQSHSNILLIAIRNRYLWACDNSIVFHLRIKGFPLWQLWFPVLYIHVTRYYLGVITGTHTTTVHCYWQRHCLPHSEKKDLRNGRERYPFIMCQLTRDGSWKDKSLLHWSPFCICSALAGSLAC